MASLWEKFESGIKKRAVSSAQGYDYEQDWLKVGLRFLSGGTDYNDAWIGDMQQRIYGTALKTGKMKPWKSGDLDSGRKVPIRIRERVDQMLLASEQPQRYNEMVESEFAPTRGAKKGEKFYTFSDKSQVQSIYKGLKKHIPEMEVGKSYNVGYSKDVKKGDSDFVNPGVIGMGRFQVGIGEDDKGKYMSVYDKWDIDAKTGIKTAEKVFDWAMPGFEMYDRVYYEEKKKPSAIMKPQRIRRAKPSETKMEKVKTRLRDRTQVDDKVFGFLKKSAGKVRDWATQEIERD
tara:strand:- start:63 stop:929 length:867 start_codon:yes stop_codon:yes gene_type:complete